MNEGRRKRLWKDTPTIQEGGGEAPGLRNFVRSRARSDGQSDTTLLSREGGAAASAQAHGGRWAPAAQLPVCGNVRKEPRPSASGDTGLPGSKADGSACGGNDDVTEQGASILNYEKHPRGGRGWLGHFWFPQVIPRRCPAPEAGGRGVDCTEPPLPPAL